MRDDDTDHPDTAPAGAFFGRRKGKRLRRGQEERLATLLPERLVPDPATAPGAHADLPGLFPHRPERIVLEIGFGGGEHLAHMARGEPEAGFIGVEPFVNGMAKMLAAIDAEDLANVRLFDRDATLLLPAEHHTLLNVLGLLDARQRLPEAPGVAGGLVLRQLALEPRHDAVLLAADQPFRSLAEHDHHDANCENQYDLQAYHTTILEE